jgi:hypothetical protein
MALRQVSAAAIEGDPARAAGLLAVAGIQNTDYREASVTARLHAANPEKARGRVLAALSGEPFTVDEACEE